MTRTTPLRALLPVLAIAVSTAVLSACAGGGGTATPEAAGSATSAGETSAAATPLKGTGWTLTTYADDSGAQQPGVTEPSLGTLNFLAAGAVAGSTGCNRFTGTYTQADSALTIEPGATTQMACPGPAGDQEAAVLAALPEVASFVMQGQNLELRDAADATLLVYAPGLASLEGTSWQATGINNGKGGVETTDLTGAVTAVFAPEGALTGSGGCNSYTSTYTTTDPDGLAIGPVASTRKACEEPVMATEAQYFAALEAVATYSFEGDRLTLRDADGATQVTYVQTAA